jgi:hypothetical protein
MRPASMTPMGGSGKFVEVDETYIGTQEGQGGRRVQGGAVKNMVLTLVERGGSARSFHTDGHSISSIVPIVRQNIRRESKLMTDSAQHYRAVGKEFAEHGRVEHRRGEYVRDGYIHSNTVENYYSIFKRGMKGIYQHCGEKHLHRYLAEFDFRYNTRAALGVDDQVRAVKALQGVTGKRLTYRRPRAANIN